MRPKILVIYNEPVLPASHPDAASEHDIVETSATIAELIAECGYDASRIGFSTDPSVLLDRLRIDPPDAVFNLFEGLANRTATEISVAALLEWLDVPFSGSPSTAIALGRDKIRTKYLLQAAGLPTSAFAVAYEPGPVHWAGPWPVIVKPACQDSSVGIEQASVVSNRSELEERVAAVLDAFGPPVLIEEFIGGREFHVNMRDVPDDDGQPSVRELIPLAEIRFDYEPGRTLWPIYSFDAKWNVTSEEYLSTPLDTPVILPEALMDRIRTLTLATWRLLGLRDYARLDVRLCKNGDPYILEVNPNPYLCSIALTRGLEAMGRTHREMIHDIVRLTLGRSQVSSIPRRHRAEDTTKQSA